MVESLKLSHLISMPKIVRQDLALSAKLPVQEGIDFCSALTEATLLALTMIIARAKASSYFVHLGIGCG